MLQFRMEPCQDQHQNQANFSMPIQAGTDSSNFQVSDPEFENHHQVVVAGFGYSDNQLNLTMDATSSNPHFGIETERPYTEEMMENSIQRRQKRLIKNRESAARSRARKQAYTKQLEHDMLQLKTTNFLLKRRKEVGMLLDSRYTVGSRYQLRRTSSALF